MSHYMLSVYGAEGGGEPPTAEEMQGFMQRVLDLEDSMDKAGAWFFGGRLAEPGATKLVMTGGIEVAAPPAGAGAQIAGFYIIEAKDDDTALAWAGKVADAVGAPIEVRPFAATGRVKDRPAG